MWFLHLVIAGVHFVAGIYGAAQNADFSCILKAVCLRSELCQVCGRISTDFEDSHSSVYSTQCLSRT